MMNPNPQLQIRIKTYDPTKLVGQLLPDNNPDNIVRQLTQETVYLPNYPKSLKHGDVLNFYGEDAIYLYNLVNQINSAYSNVVEVLYYGRQNSAYTDGNSYVDGVGRIYVPTGSINFTSSNNYLTVPASSDFSVGNNDFTFEWFQNTSDTNGIHSRIFSIGAWPNASLAVSFEGGNLLFWYNTTIKISQYVSNYANNWKHFAVVRQSNAVRFYYDGQYVTSATTSASETDASHDLWIGWENNSQPSSQFKGYITNFHFVNGTALYTGTGSINVPSDKITAVANTKLLLNAANSATAYTDSSSSHRTITNHNTSWSSSSPF